MEGHGDQAEAPPPLSNVGYHLGRRGDCAELVGSEHVNEWAEVSQPWPPLWAQQGDPETGQECVPLTQLTEKGGTVTDTDRNIRLGAVESKGCQS